MNQTYFNLFKFAQIENILKQRGFSQAIIDQIPKTEKSVKRYLYEYLQTNLNATEQDVLHILNNPQNIQSTQTLQQKNPLDPIFENQPYTQEQFFSQIPEGYKKYITKILLNHEVKPEDLPTLLENIGDFEALKKRTALPIDRDINNYQSYRQLIDTLVGFKEGAYKENPRLKVDPRNLKGVELVSTQGQYNIWKVTDAESLKQIGEGTKWCTRESFKPASRAESYLKDYGSIFVVTNGPNLAYQFTSKLDEFQDVNNAKARIPLPINVDFLVADLIKQDGGALQYASEELRNNPQIVLEAVKQYGRALYYASEELRNNPQIVLEAVKQNGIALYYASKELKNNPQIVLEAVKQNSQAGLFAPVELRNNPQFVRELYHASEELRNNADFMRHFEQITRKACGWYSTAKYASCHGNLIFSHGG